MDEAKGVDECGPVSPYPVKKLTYELPPGLYLIKNDYFVRSDFGMRRVVLVSRVGEEKAPVYRCYLPTALYLPTATITGYQLDKVDLESDNPCPRFQYTYNLILHRPLPNGWEGETTSEATHSG